MSESVNLPALGESVTEGTVTRWLKAVGERVEVDEPLVEISTDKVDTEIPSPIAGVLEQILVAEDETVEVGAPLAIIGDGGGAAAPAAPVAEVVAAPIVEEPVAAAPIVEAPVVEAPVAPAAPVVEAPVVQAPVAAPVAAPAVTAPSDVSAESYLTPIVRKLANDNGVNLSTLVGTGVGGRIRKEDVQQAIAQKGNAAGVAPVAAPSAPLAVSPLRGTSVPFSRLRKIVAKRAVESMQQ
ncbi:MAG: biotin/lipoyl-containing protein, partial [Microbacteriaceae bacterium]